MRYNLRLHGRTSQGQKCQADVSVYADSNKQLQKEAKQAAESAAWHLAGTTDAWIPDGEKIIVEHVESLDRQGPGKPSK